MLSNYVPVFLLLIIALGFGVVSVLLSSFIGPKKSYDIKLSPYECGVPDLVGDALKPFPMKFYLIAVLFVVFDIEAVFLYPWAVIFKPLGMFGFIEMMVFVFILLLGLVYAWKKGALEWD